MAWLKGGAKGSDAASGLKKPAGAVRATTAKPDRAPTPTRKRARATASKPTPSPKQAKKRTGKPTAPPPEKPPAPPPAPKYPALFPTDGDLEGVLEKFGTHRNLKDSLQLRKTYVDIREKETRLAETEGQLISRELFRKLVGAIETGFRQMLTDLPKTVARTLYAMARSDRPLEEGESKTRELVGAQLESVKEHARRLLKSPA